MRSPEDEADMLKARSKKADKPSRKSTVAGKRVTVIPGTQDDHGIGTRLQEARESPTKDATTPKEEHVQLEPPASKTEQGGHEPAAEGHECRESPKKDAPTPKPEHVRLEPPESKTEQGGHKPTAEGQQLPVKLLTPTEEDVLQEFTASKTEHGGHEKAVEQQEMPAKFESPAKVNYMGGAAVGEQLQSVAHDVVVPPLELPTKDACSQHVVGTSTSSHGRRVKGTMEKEERGANVPTGETSMSVAQESKKEDRLSTPNAATCDHGGEQAEHAEEDTSGSANVPTGEKSMSVAQESKKEDRLTTPNAATCDHGGEQAEHAEEDTSGSEPCAGHSGTRAPAQVAEQPTKPEVHATSPQGAVTVHEKPGFEVMDPIILGAPTSASEEHSGNAAHDPPAESNDADNKELSAGLGGMTATDTVGTTKHSSNHNPLETSQATHTDAGATNSEDLAVMPPTSLYAPMEKKLKRRIFPCPVCGEDADGSVPINVVNVSRISTLSVGPHTRTHQRVMTRY